MSVAEELTRVLRDAADPGLSTHSVTPSRIPDEIARLWWPAIARAVAARDIEGLQLWREEVAAAVPFTGEAAHVTPAAIALADVALSVLGAGNPAGLDTVVEHWTDSGLLPETTPGRHQGAASMEQVQAMLLERVTPRPGPSVPVLFDVGEQEVAGRTGDLRLAVLPGGPPGLYPDPSTMGFHRADAAFARSLGLAWAVAFPGWAGAPCVLWSIVHGGARRHISGASLGAAFAVALGELADRRRWRLPVHLVRGLYASCAVTGTVDADGRVGGVDGLPSKLDAARQAGRSVVAPAANRSPTAADVTWVENVVQARRARRRWLPRRIAAAATASVLLLAVASAAGYANIQRALAGDAASIADAQLRAATVTSLLYDAEALHRDQPHQALRLGLAAIALDDGNDARASLATMLTAGRERVVLTQSDKPIDRVALGPGGVAVTAGAGGTTIWDVTDPARPSPKSEVTAASSLALDPRGHILVMSESTRLAMYDITDRSAPRQLTMVESFCRGTSDPVGGVPTVVSDVVVAWPARAVVAACSDGALDLWQVRATGLVYRGRLRDPDGQVQAVAISPLGVVVSDLGAWDVRDPAHPRTIRRGSRSAARDAPTRLVFGPDGRWVLRADRFGTWLTEAGAEPRESGRWTGLNRAAGAGVVGAWSADGETVITGTTVGTATVWHVGGSPPYRPHTIVAGHGGAVRAVALSPDGSMALTAGDDGTALLWDVSDRGQHNRQAVVGGPSELYVAGQATEEVIAVAPVAGGAVATLSRSGESVVWDPVPGRRVGGLSPGQPVRALAAASDGRMAATGGADGAVTLWDLSDPTRPRLLQSAGAGSGAVRGLAYNVDATLLAAGGDDGAVRLWRVDGPRLADRPTVLANHDGAVRTVAFAAAVPVLATGGADGTIRLWDVSNADDPRALGAVSPRRGAIQALALGPDGRSLLAVVENERSVQQWDISVPARPHSAASLTGHIDTVRSVAFGSDGRMALTSSRDGTAIVWNMIDPDRPSRIAALTGHLGPVLAATFGPDQRTVVTGGADNSAITWDIGRLAEIVADPVRAACQVANGSLSREEWTKHASGIAFHDPCST